jgi:hypothetical protein
LRAFLTRLRREPLLHFLLLAGAIFAFSRFVSGDPDPANRRIVVTPGEIEHLAATFERTWQRPPTDDELNGLVMDHVREEAAYREALALKLDRDDTVVRRRLRQKLEFISEDLATQGEPSDDELRAYYAAHASEFSAQPRYSFQHVYLNADRRGGGTSRDAILLLERLRRSGDDDVERLGDPLPLERQFTDVTAAEIASLFGPQFADAVTALRPGTWQGPIASGFGAHLVRPLARTASAEVAFEDAREDVRRSWQTARRLELNQKFYEALLQRYAVTIEAPTPGTLLKARR